MGEKAERKTITVKITLPTEKDIVEALTKLFPGVKIEVEKAEKPSETVAEQKTTEEA
jgi:glycine cleavage system regulatory protein